MAGIRKDKNIIILILFLLAGIVLGSFLIELTKNIAFLKWLSFGSSDFSLGSPFTVNIAGALCFELTLKINITIGSIIGMILAFYIYRKI